jgi:hypothetical protein
MTEEVWLEYLKDYRYDLYTQAKEYIDKQSAILTETKTELQQSEVTVERYRNLISSNYIFDSK